MLHASFPIPAGDTLNIAEIRALTVRVRAPGLSPPAVSASVQLVQGRPHVQFPAPSTGRYKVHISKGNVVLADDVDVLVAPLSLAQQAVSLQGVSVEVDVPL